MTIDNGSECSPMDLQRVAAEKAAAVLVLCNKFSSDPCMYDVLYIMHDSNSDPCMYYHCGPCMYDQRDENQDGGEDGDGDCWWNFSTLF